ncbi:uncharacterized protein LOC114540211 [Dendronephthya gigantea]|uniref:uncharacterized protein LOC114540211 n=1 Tax=Dendronephthya gigantea TaxID=151771 RepID=UPI00106C0F5B|nr:uncharacterized protein LOC114540211 [Dendronephthya gigantea]
MFPGIGVYHVRINCTNRLYPITASTISIVQVPVIGFKFDQPDPQPNDEDLVVNFTAATGTNISYTVTFYHIWEKRDIPITDVTISPDTLKGTAVIDKKHFTDRVGYYNVKITAVNLVTPLQTRVRTVTIDRPIRDPKLSFTRNTWKRITQ